MSHASILDYRVRKIQGWLSTVIHRILFQQQHPPDDGRQKASFQNLNAMVPLIKDGEIQNIIKEEGAWSLCWL